ncbi:MAG: pyridoxamine 5'-phosphate oxidase family protein, partial [Anaerolineales bacterium]|nr:pyridoxamine 5'-phosphate oxidase family protein [Anaerolineales bacterium]MDW8446930.1 pyridoxamine 5'-phosphate oxidase family protein [Anaerolineales bacterium]
CLATQLMDQLGMARSSFFNLISLLKEEEYVEQLHPRGPYLLGRRWLAWAGLSLPRWRDWVEAFEQETLSCALEETLALALPHPQGAQVLAVLPAKHRLQPLFHAGEVLSIADSAAPRLFPPWLDERTLQQGYALFEGRELVELALPICRDGRNAAAALLLSVPRLRAEASLALTFLAPLREMAMRLSYRLGATFYAPYRTQETLAFVEQSPLSAEDIEQFLRMPLVARLACLNREGKPHVVPVWQEWDGHFFYVAAWEGSQWADYLQRNPSVSLTIDEPWSPLRRVVARGEAVQLRESDYPGGTQALVARLRQRYLGTGFSERPKGRSWQAFRIQPISLRGWRGLPLGS